MENQENTANQGPVIDNNPSKPSDNAKLFAILSYFLILWLLGLLIEPEKNDPYVKNHVNNGILLTIMSIVTSVIGSILGFLPFIGGFVSWVVTTLLSIVILVLWILSLVKACKNETYVLPIIGDKVTIVK